MARLRMNKPGWRSLVSLAIAMGLPLLLSSSSAATSSQQSFISSKTIDYSAIGATNGELRSCFYEGKCTQQNASTLHEYPIRCDGSGTSNCSGCYKRGGAGMIRVGPLDTTQPVAQQCAVGQTRIFVGYQMQCANTVATGGTCTNGKLLLGCQISGDKTGNAGSLSYFGECFNGNPIVVDPTNMSALCDAGMFRSTTTGDCGLCPSGTFKIKSGDQQSDCSACPAQIDILNGAGTKVGYADLALNSPSGATAQAQCLYGTPTCTDTTYTVSGNTCIPKQCTLGMTYTTVNPDSTQAKKGSITVSYTGAQGSVLTSLSGPYSSSSSAASPITFGGTSSVLDPGTYTVTVKDTICTRTSDVALVDTPSCGMVLSVTPTQPTKKSDGTSNSDGQVDVAVSGQSGTPSTTLFDSTNAQVGTAQSGTPATFTALKADTYTIKTKDNVCTVTAKATLTQTAGSCALAMTSGATTAESSVGANDGTFAVSTTGAKGNISYQISPISPNTYTGGVLTAMSSTGAKATTLATGNYVITAADDAIAGCKATAFGSIGGGSPTSPPPCAMSLAAGSATAPTTSGGTDGTFSASASGAVGAVSWQVSPSGPTLTSSSNTSAAYSGASSGNYTIIATDAGASNCSKFVAVSVPSTPGPSPTPSTGPAPYCEWGIYSNQADPNSAGTLVTTSSVPVGGTGSGTGYVDVGGNGSSSRIVAGCLAYSNPGSPTTYSCGNSVVVQPLACIASGSVGNWQPSPSSSSYPSGNYIARVYSTSVDIISAGAVVGSFTAPSYYIFSSSGWNGTNVFVSQAQSITGFKKIAGGGAACTKQDGTAGRTSTYIIQFFLPVCDSCSGDCTGTCHWYDAGGKAPMTETTSRTTTRCE